MATLVSTNEDTPELELPPLCVRFNQVFTVTHGGSTKNHQMKTVETKAGYASMCAATGVWLANLI